MILIELVAATDALGTLRTFYVSDDVLVTGPGDTPANTAFEPAIYDPGGLGVSAYSDGRTGGETKFDQGDIVLANAGGLFDTWLNYGFDGRPLTIRVGTTGAYPNAYPAILAGTAEAVDATWGKLTIRLRDRGFIFTKVVLTNLYLGNNSLPNGLEGTASDLKGKAKPKVFGKVFQFAPPCINTTKLTFQVNDGAVADIPAVYDRAASITKGADFATSALLQAATPAGGTYITCFAEGLFRLGTAPVGQITADVTQGASAADRTVAQIIKALALLAGVAAADIAAGDIAALDTANSAVVGVVVNDGDTFSSVMDQVAASIGAFYAFDPNGIFRVGQLTAPSGTPVASIEDYYSLAGTERRPPADNGVPIWSATARHTKIWTVQTSDVAGSVTAATRAYLADEFRVSAATDPTVKTQYLLAGDIAIDTLLTAAADADAEAARLLALHKVRRDVFDVPVPLEAFAGWAAAGLRIGSTVSLTLNRFGLSGGKLFRVLGYSIALSKKLVTLTIWG